MNPVRKIYYALPGGLKKKAVTISSYFPMELIYGREYRRWKKWLLDTETWNEEKIHEFQIKKLGAALSSAYKNTVYYHRLFDECGFDPVKFRYIDQMSQIPYLTKQNIQEHIEEMVNRNIGSSQIIYDTTGGSTGIPMGMYKNSSDKIREAAFVNYIWKKAGYSNHAKTAVLRGAYNGDRGLFIREGSRLLLSVYHMTEETMQDYYGALKQFRPGYLHVYPSAVYDLSEYINRRGLSPISSVRCVLTASENLYPYQRKSIEKAFQCRVLDFYGHTEHACMAVQCRHGYQVLWQYGFCELVTENGDTPARDGETAEIAATAYDNTAMPLIRYRTMDLVSYSSKSRGSGKIIFRDIEGRKQDFILTSDGRKISIAAVNMHDTVFDNVVQYQFYQDDPGLCVLKIVKSPVYSIVDEQNIKHRIGSKLGSGISLEIQYVSDISRTKNGKYRFLEQKLEV